MVKTVKHLVLLASLLALAACGGPQGPSGPQPLFDDEALGSGTALLGAAPTALDTAALVAAVDPDAVAGVTAPDLSGQLALGSEEELASAAGSQQAPADEQGTLVYATAEGATSGVTLVDMGSGDSELVYSGAMSVQSVATDSGGTLVAFTALTGRGDHDLFLVDLESETVYVVNTPAEDERDVSMSLDGRILVWQGGTEEAPTTVHFERGGDAVVLDWGAGLGGDARVTQPSVSGDGYAIALVEESGALFESLSGTASPLLFTIQLDPLDGGAALVPQLAAEAFSDPSLDFTGGVLVVGVTSGDLEATVYYDGLEDTVLLTDAVLEHAYLTADEQWVATTLGGQPAIVSLETGEAYGVGEASTAVASAAYWARGDLTAYVGQNDAGPFVRPGDDFDEAGLTVGYHAFEFEAASSDYYGIYSIQDYDGYLLLYAGSFDPQAPETNLLSENDDYLGSWSDEAGIGTSRIIHQLEAGERYVVVTTACGADGTPCGPASGSFYNLIRGGEEPPPAPTQLPEPDDTRFDITLRFWDDSLSDEEKAIFEEAAERWSEVIVGDVANIEDFVLTEDDVTAGAPGIVGVLDDVIIDAAKVPIDGPSGVLARAGAFYVRNGGPDDFLPIYGIMEFDEAEFGPGGFFEDMQGFKETILHEMGHVLGISRSFWIPQGLISGYPPNLGVCSNVANGDDPRYEGTAGNEAWVDYYGAEQPKVPIANESGCGTSDSHWREIYLQDELMTGFAQGGGEPLSRVTIGALEDLGYDVNYDAADDWFIPPLPRLSQVSPNPQSYTIEWDFTSAFTGSLLGEVEAAVTAVDLNLETPAASNSGCEMEDFADFPEGDIALMQRGTCAFGLKAANALAAGAVGVLIGNQGNAPDRMAPSPSTFGEQIDIVGVPISYDLMVELAELAGEGEVVVAIDTDTSNDLEGRGQIGPQALPRIVWHLAEELLPILGAMDSEGNLTLFD